MLPTTRYLNVCYQTRQNSDLESSELLPASDWLALLGWRIPSAGTTAVRTDLQLVRDQIPARTPPFNASPRT
jgi:hypothetical protein